MSSAGSTEGNPVVCCERTGGIAIVTLNEPARLNCLSMAIRAELLGALTAIEHDPNIRVIVLTGAGGNFCAGGDIASMREALGIARARERVGDAGEIARMLARGSKPVIAAVEGWAAGAGLSLCALCDTVVASSDARFRAGFGQVGLLPDMGLLHSLPRRIGVGRARTMLFYGEPVDVAQAHGWGLVDVITPAGTALEEAVRLAKLLEKQAPLPIAVARAQLSAGIEEMLAAERNLQALMFQSQDHTEGREAFLGKRKAAFTGQ